MAKTEIFATALLLLFMCAPFGACGEDSSAHAQLSEHPILQGFVCREGDGTSDARWVNRDGHLVLSLSVNDEGESGGMVKTDLPPFRSVSFDFKGSVSIFCSLLLRNEKGQEGRFFVLVPPDVGKDIGHGFRRVLLRASSSAPFRLKEIDFYLVGNESGLLSGILAGVRTNGVQAIPHVTPIKKLCIN
jgi:hypothetical protein